MEFSLKMRYLMSLLYFCDLDLIFKIKRQLRDVKFPLKVRYFLNQFMDIHQTCMDMSLLHAYDILSLW